MISPPKTSRQAFTRALVFYAAACGFVLGTVWGISATESDTETTEVLVLQ